MSDPKWFSPSVRVRTERIGLAYEASNVRGAAEQLLKWEKRGPKWRKAVETCMAALEDKATPQEARKAFEVAAKESGMLMAGSPHSRR